MKITRVEIDDYRQFKNIKFDFTYPKDHAKAGQPLEKACFIGQSGTGKTTVLNVLWDFLNLVSQASDSVYNSAQFNSIVDNSFIDEVFYSSRVTGTIGDAAFYFDREGGITFSDKDFLSKWFVEGISKAQQREVANTKKLSIYIKDSIARESSAFLSSQKQDPVDLSGIIKTESQFVIEKENKEKSILQINKRKNISLGDLNSLHTWEYLLQDIYQYDEKGRDLVMSIVLNRESITADQLIKRLTIWRDNTPNPRVDLAKNCLNPILNHFFLEMDTESGEILIKIKLKNGQVVDSAFLSTGTRQILATFIPLYKFDTEKSIILFDEPERSLFPDIQRELIGYYTKLAPNAQFFYATHSPIIASAFEPCERFILRFDENGQVELHRGIAPEGDDPNDILRQDFDMPELMLEKGLKEYERYRRLGMQIREEANEERKNQLIAERLELGNRYNFAGRNA